jgi:hypothetical protein
MVVRACAIVAVIAIVGRGGAVALAQDAAPPADAANGVAPKAFPLLALIIKPLLAQAGSKLAEGAGDQLAEGVQGLFSRYFGAGKKAAAAAAAASSATSATPAANPTTTTAATGGGEAVVPSLIYSVDRLDPQSYAALAPLDVASDTPHLKTGDVFALRYATNLPGQVRVDNIDALGVRTPLGTYNVLPGQDNRIPRSRGIQLSGTTGLETFRLYFYPCLPAEAAKLRGYASYKDALPECAAAAGSGGADTPLQVASKGLLRTRGARNLELDDPSMVVAAVTDYRPREVIEQAFKLQHDPATP